MIINIANRDIYSIIDINPYPILPIRRMVKYPYIQLIQVVSVYFKLLFKGGRLIEIA
jgi:hypothetical protein